MARNRYSQTSPLEALSMLGQGLQQGVGQVMQQMAQQRRMQVEGNALGTAIGELMGEGDRESLYAKGLERLTDFGRRGMSPENTHLFIEQINQMASVKPTKEDKKLIEEQTKQAQTQTRLGETQLQVAEGTAQATIDSIVADAQIKAAEAGTAEDAAQIRLESMRAGLYQLKKQNEILVAEANIATDPKVVKAKVQQIFKDISATELKIRLGEVELQQMQSVYSPEFFQKLILTVQTSATPFGDPVYTPIEQENIINAIEKTMTELGIEGVAPLETVPRYGESAGGDIDVDQWLSK